VQNLVEIKRGTQDRFDGPIMKATMARITRKHFFIIFLGLLSAFSLGSSVWSDSVAQTQDCSGDCEKVEQIAVTLSKTLDVGTASFTPAAGISVLQAADLGGGSDVRAATWESTLFNTDQGATSVQALKNPGTEGGSTPGPDFFLLIGLALISVRLVISYRSRKVKNLATGTH
jgi:hypothetical protein